VQAPSTAEEEEEEKQQKQQQQQQQQQQQVVLAAYRCPVQRSRCASCAQWSLRTMTRACG